MLVEIWSNLISLCQTLLPMLPPAPKLKCKKVIDWVQSQPNKHHGIDQVEIDFVVLTLDGFKRFVPPEWAKSISNGIYFLKRLNDGYNPAWLTHPGTCTWWDYFWYDNACHAEKKPVVIPCHEIKDPRKCIANGCHWWANSCHPEPKPTEPPKPVPCSAHTTQNDCLAAGCYWWDGVCHPDTKPPPPPPPPPPIILTCSDYEEQTKCLSNGCYWWGQACHDSPEKPPPGTTNPLREFAKQVHDYCGTIPLTKPIELINCGILSAILFITADVIDFMKVKK